MTTEDVGTFKCPICQKTTPHQHSLAEMDMHRAELAQRNLRQWMIGETQYDGGRTFGQHYDPVKDADGKQIALLTPLDAQKVVKAHNADLKLVEELRPPYPTLPALLAVERLYENPSAITLYFHSQESLESTMKSFGVEIGPPVSFGSKASQ